MLERELKDVYVTDHTPTTKKFSTLSEQEDLEYYTIVRSLEEYKANAAKKAGPNATQFNSGRYELGSLQQVLFEPLASAKTLENGTVFYELQEKEVSRKLDDELLRKQFDMGKELNVVEAEDENETRIAMFDHLEEAGFDKQEWDAILARELNTF